MKKLTLNGSIKKMLSKEQMKMISGGNYCTVECPQGTMTCAYPGYCEPIPMMGCNIWTGQSGYPLVFWSCNQPI